MRYKTFKTAMAKFAVAAAVVSGLGTAPVLAAEPVKIAITNWADVLATANIAKYVLENKLNQPVKFVTADIGMQYQGVARGDLDIMVGGWLPVTHAVYYKRFKNDMVDVGIIYSGGKNGWAVPSYVPKSDISSIADLKKPGIKDKLGGVVQGIGPGAGLMQASEKAMKEYGLGNYTLQSSSEAGMLTALSRAYRKKNWIVVTVWSPHWLWQKWDMRYLKDPKGALGGEEHIHAFASKQFATKFPRAATFFRHFKLKLSDVEAMEYAGSQSNDYAAAAKQFVDSHPKMLKAWLQQ
jgi:glycine betaine/proline transport system substrate-binding protein